MEALTKGKTNEVKMNDSFMRLKSGNNVLFGDIIQLRHVKSGKFVSVIQNQVANIERENSKVQLVSYGSQLSWLQVLPRYKIDKEGDKIAANSEILMKIAEKSSPEYLHVAERISDRGFREINSSTEAANSFRLSIFQSFLDTGAPETLMQGELVYFRDPETQAVLMPIFKTAKAHTSGKEGETSNVDDDDKSLVSYQSLGSIGSLESIDEFIQDNGDVVLRNVDEEDIDTNAIWVLESKTIDLGGPLKWATEPVHLRHINTGKYLTVKSGHGTKEHVHVLTLSETRQEKRSLFFIEDLQNTNKVLCDTKAIRIKQGDHLFIENKGFDDHQQVYPTCCTNDSTKAASLIINRYSEIKLEDMKTQDVRPKVQGQQPLDMHTGLSARNQLLQYVDRFHLPSSDDVIISDAEVIDKNAFVLIIQRLMLYVQGYPILLDAQSLASLNIKSATKSRRQNMFLQQGVFQVILELLYKLKPVCKLIADANDNLIPVSPVISLISDVTKFCFQLLLDLLKGSSENQNFLADHMQLILTYVSVHELAAQVASETLTNNRKLQETKIGYKEIVLFADKMRQTEMSSIFLKLLQTCCSANNEGLPKNQLLIFDVVFRQYKDVLISIQIDTSTQKADWTSHSSYSLYVPQNIDSNDVIMGLPLFKEIPKLKISFNSAKEQMRPDRLYGESPCSIREVFRLIPRATSNMYSALNQTIMRKRDICDFFVCQINLAADLCMGRNCIAIHEFQRLFSFEQLIGLMKSTEDERVSGAATRLLTNLYVDCEPQFASIYPRITRTLSDIVNDKSTVSNNSMRYKFCLLQVLISDYLKEVKDKPLQIYSYRLLQLLYKLVIFDFYPTEEAMNDILNPLFSCLKRTSADVNSGDNLLSSEAMKSVIAASSKRSKKGKKSSPSFSEKEKGIEMVSMSSSDNATAEAADSGEISEPKTSILMKCFQYLFDNSKGSSTDKAWVEPERYSKTNEVTVQSMLVILDILSKVQKLSDDKAISNILTLASKLRNSDSDPSTWVKVFFDFYKKSNSTFSSDHDDIFLDLLMYSSPVMVQSTLDIMLSLHASKRILLQNISNIQLLSSNQRESQYSSIVSILEKLKWQTDTYELWGKMESPNDITTSKQTISNLEQLESYCKRIRKLLCFDQTYEPDPVVQVMLKNLGCFDVCFQILQKMKQSEVLNADESFTASSKSAKSIAIACNNLLYWLTTDNKQNQVIVYEYLPFLMEIIDKQYGSNKVIEAIFENNPELMKAVPKQYINNFVSFICNSGRFPEYLSLLGSVVCAGEMNIIQNQYEVIRALSSPGSIKKVVQYFVPVNHPEYSKKVKSMSPYLNKKDVRIDELPADLAYHFELMNVLSRCTVGKAGMTTIEAKVQSMFFFVDVINAILDPNCFLLGKIRLGLFLLNAIIEVEMRLPSLKDADCMWKLLESTLDIFMFSKEELRMVEKNGWGSPAVHRQKIEYMIVCARIVGGYFEHYYDRTIFKSANVATIGVELMTIKEGRANEVIKNLYINIFSIYEMQSPVLTKNHQKQLYDTLVALNRAHITPLASSVENFHDVTAEFEENINYVEVTDEKFDAFFETVKTSDDLKADADSQTQNLIDKLNSLPKKDDLCESDIRFEPLVLKLVRHIQGCVQIVVHGDETIKLMSARCTESSIWIIKLFRTMIESAWGMTIYERDDDGGEEQDEAAGEIMTILNKSGATEMCLDLIARGLDIPLQAEALKLLVALLFKEGGAFEVQKSINKHLSRQGSHLFFQQVRTMLQNLIAWHKWNGIITLNEGDEPNLPDEIILVRCLQLMCEGHFHPNQDIMRQQPQNRISINLLDDFVQYIQALDANKCRTSTTAALAVTATILEVIQGPCEGNQDHFALNTELIEVLNRKLRQRTEGDCVDEEEIELKKTAVDIFQALLEGQGKRPAVYDRMISVIHLDVVKIMCIPPENPKDDSEEAAALRTECMVLMQMLCDFKPRLRTDFALEDISMEDNGIACVEVVWRGELMRRFFPVPAICKLLSDGTKNHFVNTVDRSALESKIYGMLHSARAMYREMKYQQLLKNLNLTSIFNQRNHDRVAFFSFIWVIILNILYIVYYGQNLVLCPDQNDLTDHNPDDYKIIDDGAPFCLEPFLGGDDTATVSMALHIIVIILSGCTLILFLISRLPIIFETYLEDSGSLGLSCLYTAVDMQSLYHAYLVIFAVLGSFDDTKYLFPFLLLDIVVQVEKLKEVLMAVWIPRRALFFTVVLVWIITYIYAMFQFLLLNTEADVKHPENVVTLVNAVKFYIRYGSETGSLITYNDTRYSILSNRYIMELSYFFIMFTIWNIFKGIVLDTFKDLKEKDEAREGDQAEICFMCGIDQKVFSRAIDRDAFPAHIEFDHNPFNYIYYMIFIWEQDKDDDDGLEYYIRHMVEDNDLSWFPLNKSIRLFASNLNDGELSVSATFSTDLVKMEQSFDSQVISFKEQLRRSLEKVETILSTEEDENASRRATSMSKPKSGGNSILEPLSRMNSMNSASTLESAGTKKQLIAVQNEFVRVMLKNISGLILKDRDAAAGVAVKITSDVDVYTVKALPLSQEGATLDSSQEGKVSIYDPKSCVHNFGDIKYLVHKNPVNLNSNYGIRLQVIQFNVLNMSATPKFLGCIDIPIPALLYAVQCGGNVHAKFFQGGADSVENECNITLTVEHSNQ